MNANFVCLACGKEKPGSPRSADKQSYCGEGACQRARKALWQRQRMAADPDYHANQQHCYQEWCRDHSGYWSGYRQTHPKQAERNRLLQRQRNCRRRCRNTAGSSPPAIIAKMDASVSPKASKPPMNGEYWLVPVIAKMDALRVKITTITVD